MAVKKIYFVRHGETDSNSGNLYQSPDVLLSERGLRGAAAVAKRCSHLDVDVIIASSFARAQQTAQCIRDEIQKPLITSEYAHEVINARFMWGKRFDCEEALVYQKERKEHFVDPEWGPDGAENFFDVNARVRACIHMLEESQYSSVIFVSHGNFIRFIIAHLLLEKSDDPETNLSVYRTLDRMSNVAITECVYENGKWRLFTWNDHAHFAE